MVARRAHNPKAVGSNPAPATKKNKGLSQRRLSPFLFSRPTLGFYLHDIKISKKSR